MNNEVNNNNDLNNQMANGIGVNPVDNGVNPNPINDLGQGSVVIEPSVTPTPAVEQPVQPMQENNIGSSVIDTPVSQTPEPLNNNIIMDATPQQVIEPTPVAPQPAPTQEVVQNTVQPAQNIQIDNSLNGQNVTPQQVAPNSYTNPQSINPNLMPGMDSNSIGTTPPISLEPDNKPAPKKKGNKTLFVIIIFVALCFVGGLTYWLLNNGVLKGGGSKVVINTKDLQISLGDTVPVDIGEYAEITGTDSKNCILEGTRDINNKVEGSYEYRVVCGGVSKSGKVFVIDNSDLIINTKNVYKLVNDEIKVAEFIENENKDYDYDFREDEETLKKYMSEKGTYKITVVAAKGTKTAESEATLYVLDSKIKGYITCSAKEETISDISATMVVKEKFVLLDDGDNSYAGIAEEIHEFTFTDETKYTEYLDEYKEKKDITINSINGKPIFDDEEKTITMNESLDNEKVLKDYGEENMKKFRTIQSHFGSLGYKCAFTKAE